MFAVTKRTARIARDAGAALALLATSLLLLQPICATAEALDSSLPPVSLAQDASATVTGGHHDSSADPCCASLDAPPVAAAASASSGADERFVVVPHAADTPQRQAALDSFAAPPFAAFSLPPLRYYARSARILR
jgi:hypothetical protein